MRQYVIQTVGTFLHALSCFNTALPLGPLAIFQKYKTYDDTCIAVFQPTELVSRPSTQSTSREPFNRDPQSCWAISKIIKFLWKHFWQGFNLPGPEWKHSVFNPEASYTEVYFLGKYLATAYFQYLGYMSVLFLFLSWSPGQRAGLICNFEDRKLCVKGKRQESLLTLGKHVGIPQVRKK